MRKLKSVFKLSSQQVFGFPTRSDTNRAVWPKEMARDSDLVSRGSFLSVYAVQPCGYATLFLHMQIACFLMTRLILWKPKIIITQACSCIMQRSLKEMARDSDLVSRGSLLSVYAVQLCGYATLFLHMQNACFLMTRLILWKPKIIITQACSCIMQRSLKAIK